MSREPIRYADVESCVEETLQRVGRRLVVGTPLGLGKPSQLINELYRRAAEDPRIELRIFTALSLSRPHPASELEKRLMDPLVERLFGDNPELAYVAAIKRGTLPANIRVSEFFFQGTDYLRSPVAQRSYMSSNYTHVVRDLLDAGVNVVAQLVGVAPGDDRLSLSCNPDLTLDLLPELERREKAGQKIALLAQTHPLLPFMEGDAAVAPSTFHGIVDNPDYATKLVAPPNEAISTTDYHIALHASALIRDGGTLQLGIGSLGDAVTYLLELRHRDNDTYREALAAAGTLEGFGETVEEIGGTTPFDRGLYAATEMLVDGFLCLYRSGILKRRVYPHAGIQRLVNEGRLGPEVDEGTLPLLVAEGVVGERLSAAEVELLQALGILRPELRLRDGKLVLSHLSEAPEVAADLGDEDARRQILQHGLGESLAGGALAHAGFFLGPESFYQGLRELSPEERRLFHMTRISFVNQLYGDEELKREQRRDARFLNSGLMATLNGAVVSDGLEDGRVLSGVGGQYNFVAMAHALPGGRSVLMVRSVWNKGGHARSNLVWSYGHITIPRHLRDLLVTEYGIADLRGKTDEEVMAALLHIADSRFQEELLHQAQKVGKLPRGYRIPDRFRQNVPERLETSLADLRRRGLFTELPYGTDLTDEEVALIRGLRALKSRLERRRLPWPGLTEAGKVLNPPERALPLLERMDLLRPRSLRERLLQKVVLTSLVLAKQI